MNYSVSQWDRAGKLHTSLGRDFLVLKRFDGIDFVNDIYDYTVEALSLEPNVDFDQIIGTNATVELASMQHGPRYFDGIVTEAQWSGVSENGNIYKFQLRPWLWLASKRRNQRIFHNKSVVDILKEVLGYWGQHCKALVNFRLTESYGELEYTVQYQESDLDFVRRLMEQFGISFFFTHDMGKHRLIITDTEYNYETVAGDTRLFKRTDGPKQSDEEYFWDWKPKRHLTTGAIRLMDYNFKKPDATMEVDYSGDATYAQGLIESYDYPGNYGEQADGRLASRIRTTQERGADHRHEAVGNPISLSAGMKVTLEGNEVEGVTGVQYLCLSARHSFKSEAYGTEAKIEDGNYSGQYVFTPASAPYAPPSVTHIPRIHGPQTATVVGEGEIDCDEFGRILVHFPWDLDKAYSMRCRVSQISAHKGWGAMVIPRIGMEVVVEFLDGDPNKPLVTGCVYNGKNKPPYELPANKSQSGFLSTTHEGSGSNQLRFEDQADKQEVFLHAQKDYNAVVLNNESYDIGVDRSKKVGNNQTEDIGNDKTISVINNHTETIGNNSDLKITNNSNTVVGNNQSVEVGSNHDEKVKGAFSLKVGEAMTTFIKMARSVTVGLASSEQVGMSKTTLVGIDQTTKVGKTKLIDVGSELTIKVGSSKLVMKKDGTVIISGKKMNIKMDGTVSVNGSKIDLN